MASGSFGPTTVGRVDFYVEQFQAAGGSMVMLAKGNRSEVVTESCDSHGGFYLGSIGGPAARLAQDCITSVSVLEPEELGWSGSPAPRCSQALVASRVGAVEGGVFGVFDVWDPRALTNCSAAVPIRCPRVLADPTSWS